MHTITDKVTATTFAVVKGRIPAELLAGLEVADGRALYSDRSLARFSVWGSP